MVGGRLLGGVVFVVAPAVAVAVPVVAARRGAGAGSGSGTVPAVAGTRAGTVPAAAGARRRRRKRRRRRQLIFGEQGLLVLGDVGVRVPVVEVAGGAVDQPAPRLRQRRVIRRVPWGGGSCHCCRQIWSDTLSPARICAGFASTGEEVWRTAAATRG